VALYLLWFTLSLLASFILMNMVESYYQRKSFFNSRQKISHRCFWCSIFLSAFVAPVVYANLWL